MGEVYRNPLHDMRIRGADEPLCGANNTLGMVRNGGTRAHHGWDLAAALETPAFAIADGKVVYVTNTPLGDYGVFVILEFQHRGRPLYALYAHLLFASVKTGERVKAGQSIGLTGRTGNADHTAPHLHFEIRRTKFPPYGGQARLADLVDPGEILGPAALTCTPVYGPSPAGGASGSHPVKPKAAPKPKPRPRRPLRSPPIPPSGGSPIMVT